MPVWTRGIRARDGNRIPFGPCSPFPSSTAWCSVSGTARRSGRTWMPRSRKVRPRPLYRTGVRSTRWRWRVRHGPGGGAAELRGAKSPQSNHKASISPRTPAPGPRPAPQVPALVLWNEQGRGGQFPTPHPGGGGRSSQAAGGHQRGPALGPCGQHQCLGHDGRGHLPLGLLCLRPMVLGTLSHRQGRGRP